MIEKSTVTADVKKARHMTCAGPKWTGILKRHAHRRTRRAVRLRLAACADFDALLLNPKRLTGWEIA